MYCRVRRGAEWRSVIDEPFMHDQAMSDTFNPVLAVCRPVYPLQANSNVSAVSSTGQIIMENGDDQYARLIWLSRIWVTPWMF